jgi:hypothetical protein
MQHVANMSLRSLICSGHKVADSRMTDADREWAANSNVIRQDESGRWYHTKITDRDRAYRRDYWNPDTGPWRKGVNY